MDEDKFIDVDPSVEMDEDFKYGADPSVEMDPGEQKRQTKAREEFITRKYKEEEEMMILLFVQWCVNHELDPVSVYEEAYPEQGKNKILTNAIENTVPKETSNEIPHELVQQALQAFGNDDLVFVIFEKISGFKKKE